MALSCGATSLFMPKPPSTLIWPQCSFYHTCLPPSLQNGIRISHLCYRKLAGGQEAGPLAQLDFERLSVARPLSYPQKAQLKSILIAVHGRAPVGALVGDVRVSHPGPVWLIDAEWVVLQNF